MTETLRLRMVCIFYSYFYYGPVSSSLKSSDLFFYRYIFLYVCTPLRMVRSGKVRMKTELDIND